MSETSSASTKLLHGGLRYLEHGAFRLVREALAERAWWLRQAPHLCHPIELLLPVRSGIGRARWKVKAGLWLYEQLAGANKIRPHRWLSRDAALASMPDLCSDGLTGAFAFWDGQMDDLELGRWAANRALEAGAKIVEGCAVESVSTDGRIRTASGDSKYDLVFNVTGPWASKLLEQSGVPSRYHLDLVRGSHILTRRPCAQGVLAEIAGERRIGFVLPWKGGTLVGTTEVRQSSPDRAQCSMAEQEYIRAFHDSVLATPLREEEVAGTLSGVRPLIRSAKDPTRATREYAIERIGNLISVFGGKWTTARALGERVAGAFDRA